jgi:hypothetical protein
MAASRAEEATAGASRIIIDPCLATQPAYADTTQEILSRTIEYGTPRSVLPKTRTTWVVFFSTPWLEKIGCLRLPTTRFDDSSSAPTVRLCSNTSNPYSAEDGINLRMQDETRNLWR